jgi:hypothetical protein
MVGWKMKEEDQYRNEGENRAVRGEVEVEVE